MDLQKYQKLKDKAEVLQREADRAAGAMEQLKSRLLEEFGCKTLKQARNLLEDLEKDEREASKEFEDAMKEFETEFGELLEDE